MSKEEILLELVLDKFTNIKELLNGTKDIENCLIKLKLNKKRGVDTVLKKTKNLVDSLYEHSVKVKEEFYSKYNALENSSEPENTNDCEENSTKENTTNIECETNKNLVNTENENQAPENIEQVEDVITDEKNIPGNKENKDKKAKGTNPPNNLDEDPLKEPDSPTVIESSILADNEEKAVTDNETELSATKKTSEENNQDCKSLIRLVDLSKLIDPKQKKTVKFDSSIIILTSSDEETPTPKKNKKTETSNLKSALTKINKYNSDDTDKEKHEGIDDDTRKKNKKGTALNHSRKSNSSDKSDSEGSDSDVSESENMKKNKRHKKKSKDSSDSDVQEVPSEDERRTKKYRNKKKSVSLDMDKNKSKKNSESESENVTEAEDESYSFNKGSRRKSSRIQTNQTSKETERKRLKKLFNHRLASKNSDSKKKSKRESSSDSDSESIRKNKPSAKKTDLVEKHLSDTSNLSSAEDDTPISKSTNKKDKSQKRSSSSKPKTGSVDKEDEKLKYEAYIPLPRIECRRLQEIYLKNKEIFEIKRLTKLDMSRNQKRSRRSKNGSDKSSSDAEKPKNKKSKKNASEEKESSDDEPLMNLKDDVNNTTDNLDVADTSNKDEDMADIALEEINKCSDENKADSSNSESELECIKKKNQATKAKKNGDGSEDKENADNAGEKSDEDTNDCEMGGDEAKKISEDENENLAKEDKENKKNSADKSDKGQETENDSDSDGVKSKKKNWRKDKLLTTKIDSTDSEEEMKKCAKKKNKSKNDSESDTEPKSPIIKKRNVKKRTRKAVLSSDSEGSNKSKNEDSDSSKKSESSSKNKSDDDSDKEEVKKKPARKRIKRAKDSSSSEEDKSTRKNIRRLIGRDSLSETTKQAEAEEKERKARIVEKQKKYNKMFETTTESKVDKVVLDYDEVKNKELVSVGKKIVKKLKPHQASGVQFMWDACFESVERAKKTTGSGCILAHCMGLGKTLQVIALAHTLLTNEDSTGVRKIMVVCPLNTVLNWKSEFKKWMPKEDEFEVYELVSCKQNYERQYIVSEWHNDGGVLIIGYNMFRNLSNPDNKRLSKKMRNVFNEGLVDPGPDLVVCDEGHLLKNEKTHLSIAMNRIKTLRRIVLTGTPLQNNLKEYWCMVQFIKPNLLGTYKEYLNRFVNPITNGQYTDSTQHDTLLMRKRSHVLHKLLDGVVQRRDYAVLEPYLPPKYEYVLFIQLTETQVKLYRYYMEKLARQGDGSNRTSFLFADFQELQRICTHPRVLLDRSRERREKEVDDEESEGSLKDFIDDGDATSDQSSNSSSSGANSDSDGSDGKKSRKSKGKQQRVRVTRAQAAQKRENNEEESEPEVEEVKKEWFQEYCDGDELDNINNSGKLFLLFQILKECEEIGDKVLVFSQSLYTLNCIEYFLEKIDEATQKGNTEKVGGHSGSWAIGLDYFRLDGTSSCDNRAIWCDMFNNPDNTRARLFLISTKAGGLGINLVAANRVIIFDVSWNPSHDIQSIYRVYRFGQTKPCYIYRFVTYGTMEMKIYERQVTKQAISKRVIDEQQIDRHYNQNDLQELYKCDLEPSDRPIPMVPKDVLLGEMLQKYDKTIYKYHLHQSLLENKEDEGLNEEERKAAWEEFENEKVLRKNTGFGFSNKVNAQTIETALASIVRKDNPTWSEVQIKGIIPALVQQLQVQLTEGDMTMYARVNHEIQLMQEIQAQKLREAYYQQQVMRMIQRQQQQAKMMGNLYVDPLQFAQGSNFNNAFAANMNQGGPSTAQRFSNDVIELND